MYVWVLFLTGAFASLLVKEILGPKRALKLSKSVIYFLSDFKIQTTKCMNSTSFLVLLF
jgi:hypothetical protein